MAKVTYKNGRAVYEANDREKRIWLETVANRYTEEDNTALLEETSRLRTEIRNEVAPGYYRDADSRFGTQKKLNQYKNNLRRLGARGYSASGAINNSRLLQNALTEQSRLIRGIGSQDEYDELVSQLESAAAWSDAVDNFDVDAATVDLNRLKRERDRIANLSPAEMKQYVEMNGPRLPGYTDGAFYNMSNILDELDAEIDEKNRYINQIRSARTMIDLEKVMANKDFAENSAYNANRPWSGTGTQASRTYDYINSLDNRMAADASMAVGNAYESAPDEHGVITQMTQQEIAVFNYYFNTQGEEAAMAYLDALTPTIRQRRAAERFEELEGRPVAELAFGVGAGLDQFASGVSGLVSNEAEAPSWRQYASGMVREDLSNARINPNSNAENSAGQIAYDAITSTSNMLPSILASSLVGLINPVAGQVTGAALMGASSSGNAFQEMLNLGYDKTQARAYSLLVGGSEAALSYLLGGITSLGGALPKGITGAILKNVDNALGRIAIQYGSSVISEFSEEYLQSILEPYFQNLILHAGNDIKLVTPEAIYAGILGAITAGILEGGGNVVNAATTANIGKKFLGSNADINTLKGIAQTITENEEVMRLGEKVNENSGAYTVGRLVQEIGGSVDAQTRADVIRRLSADGVDTKDAKIIADAVVAKMNGKPLSRTQERLLAAFPEYAKAADESAFGRSREGVRNIAYRSVLSAMSSKKASDTTTADVDSVAATSRHNRQEGSQANRADTSAVAKAIERNTGIDASLAQMIVDNTTDKQDEEAVVRAVSYIADMATANGATTESVLKSIVDSEAAAVLNDGQKKLAADLALASLESVENQKRLAYDVGYSLQSMDDLDRTRLSGLTEEQISAEFNRGVADRKANTENRSKLVPKADKPFRPGKVLVEGNAIQTLRKFNTSQKRAYHILTGIARLTGKNIVLFESGTDAEGNFDAVQGQFDPKDPDTVRIDINAGIKSLRDIDNLGEYTMLRTFTHEFVHSMEVNAPAQYDELMRVAFDQMHKNGANPTDLIEAKIAASNGTLSYDDASHEVLADALVDILPQTTFIETLASKHQNIFRRLYAALKSFLAKIREAFAQMNQDTTTAEAQALKQSVNGVVRYAQKIVDLFDKAALAAVETVQSRMVETEAEKAAVQYDSETNSAAHQQTNENPTGKVRYRARRNRQITEEDIQNTQKIGEKSVNEFSSNDINAALPLAKKYWGSLAIKSPFFRAWFGEWRENDKSPIIISSKKGTSDVAKNNDTGWDIQISRKVVNETTRHESWSSREAQKYLPYIKDIVENAVLLDSYGFGEVNSVTSLLMHSFYAVVDDGSGPVVLKLYADEFYDSKQDDTRKRAYKLRAIEKIAAASVGVPERAKSTHLSTLANTATMVKTVADLASYVKRHDDNYSPHISSKVVNSDGTPKIMYHGTSNYGFDSFDTYYSNFGLFGLGTYFTDNRFVAESYTEKGKGENKGIYEVYLNVRNPLNMDESANIAKWKKAFSDHDLDETYLDSAKTNEDAFRAMKEAMADAMFEKHEAWDTTRTVIEGMGYDGITHTGGGRYKKSDGTKHQVYIIFEPEQAKSVDNLGTFDPGDHRMRFQRRENLTDREVLELAAGDVGMMQDLSEAEKDALGIFNDRMRKLVELQLKRREQGQIYRDNTFVKGGNRDEAIRAKNRMDLLDDQIRRASDALLKVENTDIMRRILQRARKIVEADVRQRNRETLARYRDRRDNSAEIRKYRSQIQSNVDELTKWLMKPDNKSVVKHIPEALRASVIPFLASIDFTSKRQLSGGKATNADRAYIEKLTAIRDVLSGYSVNSDTYDGYADLPPDFMERLSQHIDKVNRLVYSSDGVYVINRMTSEELKQLSELVKQLKTFVKEFNVFHNNSMFLHVYDAGDNTIGSLADKPNAGKSANNATNFLMWDQMVPAYAWERFGEGGKSIFNELMRAQNRLGFNAHRIIEFSRKTFTHKEMTEWRKTPVDIKLQNGTTVTMPVSYVMGLYELCKREAGLRHILGEGIRVAKWKIGTKVMEGDGKFKITDADINTIVRSLTDRQKAVADSLQKFMQDVGGSWGNYVTMARFGERQFGDPHYYPIVSDSNKLNAKGEETPAGASIYALLNMGFTKQLNEKANNRIMVYDIFDVFSNHMADMAQYNAYALPVVDALKWFNYKLKDSNDKEIDSVRDQMDRVYGVPVSKDGKSGTGYAQKFVIGIIKAINGTETHSSKYDTIGMKALSLYNRAQVSYNFRVVVQQPTAIIRAATVLDPSAIARASTLGAAAIKRNMDEMMKHSGIAVWKSLGFYDVNISRGLTHEILGDDNVPQKIVNVGMAGAEFADRLTWTTMWTACKEQVIHKLRLHPGDDGFYEAVNDLFNEVVYKTQVVDSVITKNAYMRDKGVVAKTLSSFMSESVRNSSMLLNAAEQVKAAGKDKAALKKAGKTFLRAAAVYAIGQGLVTVAQSFVDIGRDDDDYQKWWEKFLEAAKSNLFQNLNPFGLIPLVSTGWDMAQGLYADIQKARGKDVDLYSYTPETIIGQFYENLSKGAVELWKKIEGIDSNYTLYGAIYKFLQGVSGLAGIPAAGIVRTIVNTWNLLFPERKQKTYDAGDKNEIKYAYLDGYLTESEAIDLLVEKGVEESDDDAYWTVQGWANGEGYNKFDVLYEAALSGEDLTPAMEELLTHGYEEKDLLSKAKSEIGRAFRDGEITQETAEELLLGYGFAEDENDAYWLLRNWGGGEDTTTYSVLFDAMNGNGDFGEAVDELTSHGYTEKEVLGVVRSKISEWAADGMITVQEAEQMYKKYGGLTAEEASERRQILEWQEQGFDIDMGQTYIVDDYNEFCKPAGISVQTFMDYREQVSGMTGEGKKERRMTVIDSLPLSDVQKDALYYAEGWAQSRIGEAPWH